MIEHGHLPNLFFSIKSIAALQMANWLCCGECVSHERLLFWCSPGVSKLRITTCPALMSFACGSLIRDGDNITGSQFHSVCP
jgi:hypothetical protein